MQGLRRSDTSAELAQKGWHNRVQVLHLCRLNNAHSQVVLTNQLVFDLANLNMRNPTRAKPKCNPNHVIQWLTALAGSAAVSRRNVSKLNMTSSVLRQI